MAPILENVASGLLVVVSLALTLIAIRAARHAGTRKVQLLALGFALFSAKSLLLTWALFTLPEWERILAPSLLLDIAALGVFYLAMFK